MGVFAFLGPLSDCQHVVQAERPRIDRLDAIARRIDEEQLHQRGPRHLGSPERNAFRLQRLGEIAQASTRDRHVVDGRHPAARP